MTGELRSLPVTTCWDIPFRNDPTDLADAISHCELADLKKKGLTATLAAHQLYRFVRRCRIVLFVGLAEFFSRRRILQIHWARRIRTIVKL
jgi:hypothetical protein